MRCFLQVYHILCVCVCLRESRGDKVDYCTQCLQTLFWHFLTCLPELVIYPFSTEFKRKRQSATWLWTDIDQCRWQIITMVATNLVIQKGSTSPIWQPSVCMMDKSELLLFKLEMNAISATAKLHPRCCGWMNIQGRGLLNHDDRLSRWWLTAIALVHRNNPFQH